jgi:hypothetical protein
MKYFVAVYQASSSKRHPLTTTVAAAGLDEARRDITTNFKSLALNPDSDLAEIAWILQKQVVECVATDTATKQSYTRAELVWRIKMATKAIENISDCMTVKKIAYASDLLNNLDTVLKEIAGIISAREE